MGLQRVFVIAGLSILSALLPEDVKINDAVETGRRIKAVRQLDFLPYAVIETGETGTVDYINPANGLMEIKMDTYHSGLGDWENHIWAVPFETDDVVSGIQLIDNHSALSTTEELNANCDRNRDGGSSGLLSNG